MRIKSAVLKIVSKPSVPHETRSLAAAAQLGKGIYVSLEAGARAQARDGLLILFPTEVLFGRGDLISVIKLGCFHPLVEGVESGLVPCEFVDLCDVGKRPGVLGRNNRNLFQK